MHSVLAIVWAICMASGVLAQLADRYTNLIQTRDKATNETLKTFCILDYIYDKNLTELQKRNQFYDFQSYHYLDDRQFCQSAEDLYTSGGRFAAEDNEIKNKFVLIEYSSDCDINEQINYFASKSIFGLLITIGCNVDIDNSINITNQTLLENKFSVSLISKTSVDQLLNSKADQLKLFNINFEESLGYGFDYSIVCIWVLATFTVALGAFWSGSVRQKIFLLNKQKSIQSAKSDSEPIEDNNKPKTAEEEAFINLSPFLVLGFVSLMAIMLLLLYYFFQYLVYVIIFLFTMASIASVFACSEPIVLFLFPERLTRPSFVMCSVRCGRMYFYQLVLLVLSVSLSITWFVFRKESFSWILQDLLGVCFSLNMLRTIRLPSYKICVILLSALFFYDIFFVFITPLITSKGNSVMVDVATGGSSGKSRCGKPGEQIPMIMRIPHKIFIKENSTDPMDVCFTNRDSLLGFGDILVPGLLVSYCYAFDLIFDVKRRIYYVTACLCYGLGLIATFAGLFLMSGSAQPALLYLVPFTTIPPLLIALYRKEFKQLWVGPEAYFSGGGAQGDDSTKADNSSIEDDNLLNHTFDTQQSAPQTNS